MLTSRIQKLGILGVSIFLFSIFFETVFLPTSMNIAFKKLLVLRNGTIARKIWGTFPFALELHFYFFNITNPDAIEKGEKPILQEVGPFVYDEWRTKTNQMDREEDDTVSYTTKNTYYFNATLSSHSDEEELVVPNYFILGVVNAVLRDKPSALPIIGKALDSVLRKPTTIFMKEKVRNLLFDGFLIDCNVQDFAGSALCGEIANNYEEIGMKLVGQNQYLFSLFGSRNASDSKERTRVMRGSKKIRNVGVVVEYAKKPNISTWDDEYCDTFAGTDGTIFHPLFDGKGRENVELFNPDVCRSLSLHYTQEKVKTKGLTWLRYTESIGIDPANPRQKCYCPSTGECRKGTYDLYKCKRAPIIVTNPHFYEADPIYLDMVEGLKPNKEKHSLYIDFDPFCGAPIIAHARLQFNMEIMPLPKLKLMKNFPEVLLPLVWVDNVFKLPPLLLKLVQLGHVCYRFGKLSQHFMRYGGLAICGLSVFLYIKSTRGVKKESDTKKIILASNSQNVEGDEKKIAIQIKTLQPAPVPLYID